MTSKLPNMSVQPTEIISAEYNNLLVEQPEEGFVIETGQRSNRETPPSLTPSLTTHVDLQQEETPLQNAINTAVFVAHKLCTEAAPRLASKISKLDGVENAIKFTKSIIGPFLKQTERSNAFNSEMTIEELNDKLGIKKSNNQRPDYISNDVKNGLVFLNGNANVTKNAVKAIEFFSRAADSGDPDGLFYLGWCCANGIGTPFDSIKALRFITLAAEEGHPTAQYNLGLYCSRAMYNKDKFKLAATWFFDAAMSGHSDSQYNMGLCYDFGKGVPQDETLAVIWYRVAANGGQPDAQYNLGLCYEQGKGVRADIDEACRWYVAAAMQGHCLAYDISRIAGLIDRSQSEHIVKLIAEMEIKRTRELDYGSIRVRRTSPFMVESIS